MATSSEQRQARVALSKRVAEEHAKGLGNRQIALTLGRNHRTVAVHLRELGLPTNNPRGVPPTPIDAEHARCNGCGQKTRWEDFALIRSHADGRRASKCRACRSAYAASRLRILDVFLKDKAGRTHVRARRLGVACDLTGPLLRRMYDQQAGLCFYTDVEMVFGQGRLPNSLSLDRVEPAGGYTYDNVVLAANRANTIKQDLTLDELRAWMPGWFDRITTRERV